MKATLRELLSGLIFVVIFFRYFIAVFGHGLGATQAFPPEV